MKKIACTLVALLLLFTCTAFAESTPTATDFPAKEFSFRDGVKFGMTQQEVVNTEKETLSVQNFGEKQNSHVTILTTDKIDISGHTSQVMYLLWDGALYAVMVQIYDTTAYADMKANFTNLYGEPVAYDSVGLTNWIESVSGNRPAFIGSEYVWTWANKVTLTIAEYDGGCAAVYLKTE